TEDLMKLVRGPDFPTGGIIIGREGIAAAYGTGHGRLIVRARHTFEEAKNGRERIIITEIPYMVNKATLVARIAELVGERQLERARDRAHLLEGLKIALDNLDAVIKTIRESQDEKTAQERLQERFKLSERQSKAIVDMRLGRLTRLERNKVMEEYEEVIKRIAYLEDLLA